jgi:hypothetical protein
MVVDTIEEKDATGGEGSGMTAVVGGKRKGDNRGGGKTRLFC